MLPVWHTQAMTMREDCRHFASRLYDDGEAARFCVLDLAPEAPWRCPDNCPQYERSVIDGTFVQGSLARQPVDEEPDEKAEDIQDLLDDAEMIVEAAEPAVTADLDKNKKRPPGKWWRRRTKRERPDDGDGGDDWHLSNR
jgi:hypothetical protein